MADATNQAALTPVVFDLETIRRIFPETEARHGHPMFYEILDELEELHSKKNQQYATQEEPLGNFVRGGRLISKLLKPGVDPTLAACLAYAAKQIDGVYEIVGENKTYTIDSLEDKLKDVAIYAILALVITREADQSYKLLSEL